MSLINLSYSEDTNNTSSVDTVVPSHVHASMDGAGSVARAAEKRKKLKYANFNQYYSKQLCASCAAPVLANVAPGCNQYPDAHTPSSGQAIIYIFKETARGAPKCHRQRRP